MLNPLLIKTLLTVVRAKNFRGAAEALGLSQPAVSQHIRRLEADLKATLIRRDRKGCEPTPAALAFLPWAERALKMMERAEAALKPNQFRIGAGSNIGIYILQPLLKAFLDAHPGLEVSLVVAGNPSIAEKLESADIDLALMEWWDGRPGFESVGWRREPLVLIVPPRNRGGHASRHPLFRSGACRGSGCRLAETRRPSPARGIRAASGRDSGGFRAHLVRFIPESVFPASTPRGICRMGCIGFLRGRTYPVRGEAGSVSRSDILPRWNLAPNNLRDGSAWNS